jgi:hypothetical protein
LDFIETEHKSKNTKSYINELRKDEREFHAMLLPILELRQETGGYKKAAEELCKQGDVIKAYFRDIDKKLSDDFLQKQHGETVDLIKNMGFVVGMIVATIKISKEAVVPKDVFIGAMGAAGALGIVFYKRVDRAFQHAAKKVCPALAKKRTLLSTEQANLFGLAIMKPLANENSFMIVGQPTRAIKSMNRNVQKINAA